MRVKSGEITYRLLLHYDFNLKFTRLQRARYLVALEGDGTWDGDWWIPAPELSLFHAIEKAVKRGFVVADIERHKTPNTEEG